MEIYEYIQEAIFESKEQYKCFYELIWDNFNEVGFVITDTDGYEIDDIFKAVALQNLVGEFIYRIYDEVNEVSYEDAIVHFQTLGISDDDVIAYCESNDEIEVDDDYDITVKNALDYTTEIVADKMLEEFSSEDLFDYLFASTYDFEQDFTFDFEDYDELMAFVDTNQEQLDNYKDEYESVLNWIKSGMIV